ncbi:ASCH domain-containing protein [Bradyrhizobium sp.]|uniref:ASCH domain-containing protein n=1 Tax=Bradyrhizobium sp. TaxID=376 RepID=UPI002D1FA5C9|nr:ASCH domain-containing protein [Bradyrhizobium sp.]
MDWHDLESFAFGDSPALADELLALVLAGKKRATCWAVAEGLKGAELGKCMVVRDGAGWPRAVVKTIELTQRRYDEVDAAFAFEEGEGDRSLAYWRGAHQRYFTRLKLFQPDMMLWCERFELVTAIPLEHVS